MRRTAVLLFVTVYVAGAYWRHPLEYDNARSRYLLLDAIVTRGELTIDPGQQYTIDKSYHAGHYFSNKAPGASFLAAPAYWLVRLLPVPADEEFEPLNPFHRYLTNLCTTTLCFAVLSVVMWRTTSRWCGDPRIALLAVLAFCFGTIGWIHATMFSGHLLAACFGYIAFALLSSRAAEDVRDSTRRSVRHARYRRAATTGIAGFFAGLAVLCDFATVVVAMLLLLFVFLHRRFTWTEGIAFLGSGGVCAALLGVYNFQCFGTPFSFSYEHSVLAEFSEGYSHGFLGVTLPNLTAATKLLVSPARGMFFIMPILLFSVFGLIRMWRLAKLRSEAALITATVVGGLLMNSAHFSWHGGWCLGPRYLVWIFPFFASAMVFAPVKNAFFAAAAGLSCVQVAAGTVGVPHVPEQIANPLVDLIVPLMGHDYWADNWLTWLGFSHLNGALVGVFGLAMAAAVVYHSLPAGSASPFGFQPLHHRLPTSMTRMQKTVTAAMLLSITFGLTTIRTPSDVARAAQGTLLLHLGMLYPPPIPGPVKYKWRRHPLQPEDPRRQF